MLLAIHVAHTSRSRSNFLHFLTVRSGEDLDPMGVCTQEIIDLVCDLESVGQPKTVAAQEIPDLGSLHRNLQKGYYGDRFSQRI